MKSKKEAPFFILINIVGMAFLSIPIEFWVMKISKGFVPDIIFYSIWLIMPLTMPISHLIENEKAKIVVHLIAEGYLTIAAYAWLSAVLTLIAYPIMKIWLYNAEKICLIATPIIYLGAIIIGYINALIVKTRYVSVYIGLPEPVKLVLFSDVHLGVFSTKKMVKNIKKAVNKEAADVVVIAGDIFDMDYDSLRNKEETLKVLKELKSNYGTFACLGNHDFYVNDIKKDEFIKEAGIKVLLDEGVTVKDLNIFGRRELVDPLRKDIKDITLPDRPLVVLDHNPAKYKDYFVGDLVDHKVDRLLLCGHTHGGQTVPINLIQYITNRYPTYGLRDMGGLRMFVTSGIGYWGFPIRLGISNEVVVININ